MKNIKYSILVFTLLSNTFLYSQTESTSSRLIAQPIPDRTIYYNVTDAGVPKPVTWGLDLAWLSETNIRRGIAFMGTDRVSLIRSSFIPTQPLNNGELQGDALSNTNLRIQIINKWLPVTTKVVLNCDHPSVNSYFYGNAANWAELIDITTRMHQNAGRNVVTVSPFNEPDYTATGQGNISDFYNIAGILKNNPRFETIRISGGNTLNCDQALPWYNYLKSRLDEGNTHQLAGSFDNYVGFFQTVKSNGHYATNDELHNVMEAIVGAEYGLQTGIWWGTAEYARGELVKASNGTRLGYAEHRPNWTAAAVYRNPEGKIQAFGGTSERQATTTTYNFISKDRDVFYDGYGPQREYSLTMPGGTGYQTGQTNAERVISITWGDDVQPAINGRYALINKKSAKAMEVVLSSTADGANIIQRTYSGKTNQQWDVAPVEARIGGDFSYFTFSNVNSTKTIDVVNFSLEDGGNVQQWSKSNSSNQQWYLEYVADGWFYIRNRESAKCLEVANASVSEAANIQQWEKDGDNNQLWRFIPINATAEFESPSPPANLKAIPNAASVKLSWDASPETDVEGYIVYRSEIASGPYNIIGRNITTTSFVDNTATTNITHYYAIKAIDKSLNRSAYSNEVSASSTGAYDIVMQLGFEQNYQDSTVNLNHSAIYGTTEYVSGKIGNNAINLNGSTTFIQLPTHVANQQEITIAAWVNWRGAGGWQRIFDFGNDQTQYMFLTPNNGSGKMRFAIKNGANEQTLDAPSLNIGKWTHVAITLSVSGAKLYADGVKVAESDAINISPLDFKPILNYIGRSQFPDLLFRGYIDDFRIYNYALPQETISTLAGVANGVEKIGYNSDNLKLSPLPAKDYIIVDYLSRNSNLPFSVAVYDMRGQQVALNKYNISKIKIDVSSIPAGIYTLKLIDGDKILTKKLIINR